LAPALDQLDSASDEAKLLCFGPARVRNRSKEHAYGTQAGATLMARHRIAVIDDDTSVRNALRRLFRSADHDAEAYESGWEFLNDLEHHVPDCLVLDIHMPEMSGLELQRHLRAHGLDLPCVMITGHDEEGSKEACFAAGATSYLRKPFDETSLLKAVDYAIATSARKKARSV
jgi:FixJ family two-component response regulator